MISKTFKTVLALTLLFTVSAVFASAPVLLTNAPVPTNPSAPWAHTDEDSAIFQEDWESGLGDWTTVDVTAAGLTWHIDDFNAYSGNSWWSGDSVIGGYDNHWLQYLISPSIDLSGATNPVLTYMLNYCVEDTAGAASSTAGEYDGWDGCNVWISIDGGNNWTVVTPTTPAYTCQSMYSFGFEWLMGAGIPGWGGTTGGWVDVEMDLTRWAGSDDVKIRFAFCSDPAWCTADDPSLFGMIVDDISIDDGTTNYLENDADGTAFPDEFTLGGGEASGDWWIVDDATSHSPSHCATCVIENHYNLSNAIESPWISIPEGYTTYFTFWLWCEMWDWDGNEDGFLEDYYMFEISQDGVVWDYQILGFYDYGDAGRPGAAAVGWEEYLPGMAFNGNISMDLSSLAGEDIKFRFRVTTDDNDDGGVGDGFHFDDFTVWSTNMLNHDVGAANMIIPFPTSLSNGTIDGTVDLHNYGLQDQPSVAAFVRKDFTDIIPLAPWSSIPSDTFLTWDFSFDVTEIGDYWIDSYTALPGDENTTNDTTAANYIDVTPEHEYELGYDNRGMTDPSGSVYYWEFDPGTGAMAKFTPSEHDIPDEVFDVEYAKIQFDAIGDFTFHIFDAGVTPDVPGAEITSFTESVTVFEIAPNWKTVDISGVPEMVNRTEPFWIWVESNDPNQAKIMGDDLVWGGGHFYTYDGSIVQESTLYEFFIRVVGTGGLSVGDQITLTPDKYELAQNFPNPFNPETSISFSLAKSGHTTLRVYNMLGEEVAELVDGNLTAGIKNYSFDASSLSSGIYFYRLESGDFQVTKKMVLMK